MPDYPRPGTQIYLVDVSLCTQADLDRRYQEKRAQLAWLAEWIRSTYLDDVQVHVVPVPVAVTGKVHVSFPVDTERLGIPRH